jgi:hypothetical protein
VQIHGRRRKDHRKGLVLGVVKDKKSWQDYAHIHSSSIYCATLDYPLSSGPQILVRNSALLLILLRISTSSNIRNTHSFHTKICGNCSRKSLSFTSLPLHRKYPTWPTFAPERPRLLDRIRMGI